MTKLYHLSILYKHPTKVVSLCSASDLTSFGFFKRHSIKEFMNFTSRILVERSRTATRTSVKEQSYTCHVYVRADGLSATLISDHEYPLRVAHTLLNKILQEFSAAIPSFKWTEPNSITFPLVGKYLLDYQNPRNADTLTRVQHELDETKIILLNTLQAALQRGENLDDLVAKTEQLSAQSKAFYKTARKTNACCVIL